MKFEKGSTNKAREIAMAWIKQNLGDINKKVDCGLPEYDDRLDVWRISVKSSKDASSIGEIHINRDITKIVDYTDVKLMRERLDKSKKKTTTQSRKNSIF